MFHKIIIMLFLIDSLQQILKIKILYKIDKIDKILNINHCIVDQNYHNMDRNKINNINL